MIIVDNVVVSDEFINARFCCNLARCKGECCVAGDAGAPLEPEEVGLIEEYIEEIKPFMRAEGIEVIENNDVYDYDEKAQILMGRSTGKIYRIGDKVKAVLKEVSPITGGLLFKLKN